jgi:hypothetical protein
MEAAEPLQLARVVGDALAAEEAEPHDGALHRADDRAVLGRSVGDKAGGREAAGTGHVLDHRLRLAGNMAAHVALEHPRIGGIAAAGGPADDDLDLVAPVKIAYRVGKRATRRDGEHGAEQGDPRHATQNG